MATFEIIVPTYNRIGRTPALERLPKDQVTVLVRPREEDYYRKNGWSVRVLPENVTDIGATIHYLFTTSHANYVWRVDDDTTNEDLFEGIRYITYHANREKAGIFGFGRHYMVHNRIAADGEWSRRGACSQVWGVNKSFYLSAKVDCRKWPILEDLYTNVAMQLAGYRVLINNYITAKEKSAGSGGCIDYRTPEMVRECLKRLSRTFPRYVKVFESDRGTAQKMDVGMNFRVAWKKIHDEVARIP